MQTPSSVYVPSAREYPARVPEPEYPDTMLVRSVHKTGCFTWKKYDVFLSEVLWGERIGLLPIEDDWFTVYFAHVPVARFTSRHHRVLPLLKPKVERPRKQAARTGTGEASPVPVHKPSNQDEVSGMCPA
jgi:hypothetical protein